MVTKRECQEVSWSCASSFVFVWWCICGPAGFDNIHDEGQTFSNVCECGDIFGDTEYDRRLPNLDIAFPSAKVLDWHCQNLLDTSHEDSPCASVTPCPTYILCKFCCCGFTFISKNHWARWIPKKKEKFRSNCEHNYKPALTVLVELVVKKSPIISNPRAGKLRWVWIGRPEEIELVSRSVSRMRLIL